MTVDAVLFDLDDTLCEYRRGGEELLAAAFDDVGVDPFFEAAEYYDRYEEFLDDAEGMADLRQQCFATLADDRGRDPDLGRAVADAYARERDHSNVRPVPGAGEVVERLGADHRLGIVTNGAPEMQAEKLAALPFADAFETVVHAGHDAPAKPEPEPFHAALADLGADPSLAVHVGDSVRTDVAGARRAGLESVWFGNGTDPDPRPHHRIEALPDLLERPWADGG